MEDIKTKTNSYNKRSHRSKSSYSETDEKKSKRNRSNSYRNESEEEKSSRSKHRHDSRSISRSRSYTSVSRSNESSYNRSYRSRSMSRSPGNLTRHRKSKHHRRSRSWSHNSSHSYDGKNSRANSMTKSRSPRHSKDKKKIKDPRDKSKRELWKNKVYIVGEIMKDTVFHFCDTCQMPIFIYCRLIPCKHIFCYPCGSKYQDKKCPRCDKKVNQTERCNFGTIYMCYKGGNPHGMQGCRRTYLSQRDLDSHINHRHNKTGPTPNQTVPSQCSIMPLPVSNPLNMLPPNFINSFPNQFQQHHLQSLLQQQQMPLNQLQTQQLASMSHTPPTHMMPPLGNMMAPNQQQINPNQNQMPNQNFGLQMPHLNMMPCNMNQNNMSMINQNSQNVNVGSLNNPNNSSVSQMGPNNNLVQTTMFMHGAGPANPNNPMMMGASNSGFNTANAPPLMTQLSNLIQGISQQQQQQQQQSQAGRQFHDLQRQFQRPMKNQQQNWSNQSSQGQQGQLNHSSNQ